MKWILLVVNPKPDLYRTVIAVNKEPVLKVESTPCSIFLTRGDALVRAHESQDTFKVRSIQIFIWKATRPWFKVKQYIILRRIIFLTGSTPMLQTITFYNSVKFKVLLFISFLFFSTPAFAQQKTQVELETGKMFLQSERETILIEALQLSVSQAAVFHPIYVEFSHEGRILDDLLIKLFVQYSDNYNRLDLNHE